MSANIFISFAGQDLKVAFTLCKALESRGFKCWISSRDILPGENFQVAIVRAIRSAKMMLLVFTGNSNNSEEMTKELALASQHKLIVIPLRIEDVVANDAFAYEFATRQWIDFFADWETAINQLSERIAQAIPPEDPVVSGPVIAPPPAQPATLTPAAVPAPEPPRPAPVAQPIVAAEAVAPASAPATAKEAAVATIERPPTTEFKQPEPKPSAPAAEPVKAKDAAAPVAAPAAKPAPAKPAPPVAKAPVSGIATPAPERKKGAPIGLFISIGVVVLALIGAAVVFLPSMLAPKPPAQPAVVAASPPAPAAPATPAAAPSAVPASAIALPPVVSDSNALAASGGNSLAAGGNTLADPNAPPHPKRVHPPKVVAAHHDTEVPF